MKYYPTKTVVMSLLSIVSPFYTIFCSKTNSFCIRFCNLLLFQKLNYVFCLFHIIKSISIHWNITQLKKRIHAHQYIKKCILQFSNHLIFFLIANFLQKKKKSIIYLSSSMNVIERRSKTKDILINFLMGLLKIYSVVVLSQKKFP